MTQYQPLLFVLLLSCIAACKPKVIAPMTAVSPLPIADTAYTSIDPTLRQYPKRTSISSCEKHLIDSIGSGCETNHDPYNCYLNLARFKETDTCNNFLFFDYTGNSHSMAIIQNKERIFSHAVNDFSFFYYTDTQGNQYPILEIDSYDEGHNTGSESDCSYRLPVYFYEARAKWTPTSFEIDSLLSVNGGFVLDRYLYDSITLAHKLKLPSRKNNKVISVDNFVKIRVTEGNGEVVDTSMCTPEDENTEIIDKKKFGIQLKLLNGTKLILQKIVVPERDIALEKIYAKLVRENILLVGYYDEEKNRDAQVIIGDTVSPYPIRNHIIGFLEGYYKGADGLPLPVIAHEITMPDYDRTLHMLYRWKGNRIVADSILSLGGLPLTIQMRDSLNRLYVRKNPFEKIKGKSK